MSEPITFPTRVVPGGRKAVPGSPPAVRDDTHWRGNELRSFFSALHGAIHSPRLPQER